MDCPLNGKNIRIPLNVSKAIIEEKTKKLKVTQQSFIKFTKRNFNLTIRQSTKGDIL